MLLYIILACSVRGPGAPVRLAHRHAFHEAKATVISQLHAEYRNGQLFIVWKEAKKNRKNLRVYVFDTLRIKVSQKHSY
jgi:hypothetical protein